MLKKKYGNNKSALSAEITKYTLIRGTLNTLRDAAAGVSILEMAMHVVEVNHQHDFSNEYWVLGFGVGVYLGLRRGRRKENEIAEYVRKGKVDW